MQLGTLYGIGVGTGDPELITLKGWKRLQNSPVVAFPAGRDNQPGFAETIIAPWLQPSQTKLPLDFPYLQDSDRLQEAWDRASDTVWNYLSQGQDIAFACEGDIGFYSTFNYLAQTLQRDHPEVEIILIPGISSPMAAASVRGEPLTWRDQRLTILPALYHMEGLESALDTSDVTVLMKVASVYPQVWNVLKRRNLLEHSYIVERATLPEQTIYTNLGDRPELSLSYFSVLIIHSNPSSAAIAN